MDNFIVKMIKSQAAISLEKGQEKYRAYFVKTQIYAKWKESVDTSLTTEGFSDCIVTE